MEIAIIGNMKSGNMRGLRVKMENKKYKVVRYFDSYPAAIIHKGLDLAAAEEKADHLNSKIKHKPFTEYLVRHEP